MKSHEQKLFKQNRPINLEDVLVALENNLYNDRGRWYMNHGTICIQFGEETLSETIHWIPNKPLHHQSTETIDFLHDLLVNSELRLPPPNKDELQTVVKGR